MKTVRPGETSGRNDRRTIRDLAAAILWVAGFLGTVQAMDGVSMAISLSLMMFAAIFLAYRGRLRRNGTARGSGLSICGIFRAVAWVTLGPLIAAFAKLQVIIGFGSRAPEVLLPLLVLSAVLVSVDRLLACRGCIRVCGNFRNRLRVL